MYPRYLTLPLKFSVFSIYVSAIFSASRILGATEKADKSNTSYKIGLKQKNKIKSMI